MRNGLIAAGSFLLAGVVAIVALSAVAAGMEEASPLPVTAASQEAESLSTATGGATAQKPERRVP